VLIVLNRVIRGSGTQEVLDGQYYTGSSRQEVVHKKQQTRSTWTLELNRDSSVMHNVCGSN